MRVLSKSSVSISIDALASEVQRVLTTFANDVESEVNDIQEEVADDAVKKLKATSPVGNGKWKGHYKNGWGKVKDGGKTVVRNKKYQITHLLEKGHVVIIAGKSKGFAPAQPHIKPVEEWVQDEFEDRIKRKVEGGI